LRSADFESAASASSAIPACVGGQIKVSHRLSPLRYPFTTCANLRARQFEVHLLGCSQVGFMRQ
jgi:hypothetical protein